MPTLRVLRTALCAVAFATVVPIVARAADAPPAATAPADASTGGAAPKPASRDRPANDVATKATSGGRSANDVGTTPSARPPPTAPAAVDISDPVIRKAIVDSREPADDIPAAAPSSFGREQTSAQRIDRRFADADLPSCLGQDATRFVPPRVGPFDFSGLLALPFWAEAIATGRCRH